MAANPTPFVSLEVIDEVINEVINVEEYWHRSAAAERKHEYLDGRMWAMSGGSPPHAMLAFNLSYILKARLTGKNCIGASADLRVRTSATGLYTYPDLSVICGPMILDDDQKLALTNPTLLVEVLSKSTESYDRGLKFDLYRQIEIFREYVLVSQELPRIETYLRLPDRRWVYSVFSGMDAICRFESIDVSAPLAEICENVVLPNPAN